MNVFYAVFPTEDLPTESLDEPISKLKAEDPHIPPLTIRKARIKMRNTFDDPKGWNRYGIKFFDITEKKDDFIKMKEASDTNSVYIKVYFYHNDNLMNVIKAPELDGFSACQPDQNDCRIYFNIDNWIGNNNGKNKTTMPMPRYQTYVINHEFGHGVGLLHPEKNRVGPGSVMTQMTRGPEGIKPSTENEYPLDPDVYDEIENNPGKYWGTWPLQNKTPTVPTIPPEDVLDITSQDVLNNVSKEVPIIERSSYDDNYLPMNPRKLSVFCIKGGGNGNNSMILIMISLCIFIIVIFLLISCSRSKFSKNKRVNI